MEGHTVRTYDGDILNLRMDALRMGGFAIDQVQRAVAALTQNDDEAAREVVERHAQVVVYGKAIEEDIIALIARRQPVASELRAVLTVGRIATDLGRVGNAARKIARLALELHATAGDAPLLRFYHDVRKMARIAVAMLREALDCFDRVDLERALAIGRRDQELDAEFHLALRELVTYVMEDQRYLRSTLQTVFVLKALERVGDHARNIAAVVPRLQRRDEGEAPAAQRPEPPLADAAASATIVAAGRDPRVLGQG